MEWQKFNTHGESQNHAFETMCNILFEKWCKREYADNLFYFTTVNGSGGDGGVEAYCVLKTGEIIGVQSKWFPSTLESSQITQIKNSFLTAVKVRPNISRYIVCIPRDMGSKRVVKDGIISANTEENRWLSLVEQLKKEFPNITVELWNDTRICAELQRKESLGAQGYWFETNEIIEDEIKLSIEKARLSWGKTKYIPDLYATGYIHDIIEEYLGSRELSQRRTNYVEKIICRLRQLKIAYEDILSLPKKLDEEFTRKLGEDSQTVDKWILKFEQAKLLVMEGLTAQCVFDGESFGLLCGVAEIKESGSFFNEYFHFHAAEECLEDIYDDVYGCMEFIKGNDNNRLILLGNPGTGKTAGIISEVVNQFESRAHIPILIHARDFANGDSWKSILEKTLGLSDQWDEFELFQTLEIASQNRRTFCDDDNTVRYDAKCFICVDGIDEAASHEFWKRMIDEAEAYKNDFQHIKFVFLSRPYVFEPIYRNPNRSIIRTIPMEGDVSVKSIFKKYCDYYHIDVWGKEWICDYLKTPLSLSIFCEVYQNRSISGVNQNSVIITNLFRKKIEQMESFFREERKENVRDSYIHTSLIKLSDVFLSKTDIEHNELYKILESDIAQHFDDVLEFLEAEGFIYSYQVEGDILTPSVTYYSWGMQPALDYLIAEQILMAYKENRDIEKVSFPKGTLQMLSILLLERESKLIYEIAQLKLSDWETFGLICYALVNVSSDIAGKYKDYLKALMKTSIDEFREIVEKVVLPCSKVKGHLLGGVLLDEFLREFDNTAQRDIWWSAPAYLRDGFGEQWYSRKEVDFDDFEIDLDSEAMDWPIVFVWRLSSTRNSNRNHARIKLLEWGMNRPEAFYELFHFCNDIDDPQILEDIYAIAYGICLMQKVSKEYLCLINEWILKNVFSSGGLVKYRNSVIRYYARSIVEIAISYGIQEESAKAAIIPPYTVEEGTWPDIAIEAIDAERMSGYGPISYDLARYVLSDPIGSDFFHPDYNSKEYTEQADIVLKYYSQKAGRNSIKIAGLVIALAYHFIQSQGWNKEVFYGYGEGKPLGLDIAIHRTYWPATHGSQSSVMSLSEKYVWCALHMIEAFLADLVPVYKYEEGIGFLDNYCEIENFINVYQDYINLKKENSRSVEWLHVEQLCNTNGITMENVENAIGEWINLEHIPNFKKWIIDNNGKTMLFSFSDLRNDCAGIQEVVWINSGYVKESEFKAFLLALDVYSEDRSILLNVSDFSSGQKSRCYCTPQETCVVPNREETNTSIKIEDIDVIMATAECITSHNEDTEKTFYLPSRFSRQILGISYGDGYEYCDGEGNVICEFLEVGESWKNQQKTLLVDTVIFSNKVGDTEYKPFWIYRELREPSLKASERFGKEIYCRFDRTFVVWFDGEECVYKELIEVEPPQKAYEGPVVKILDDIISIYMADESE